VPTPTPPTSTSNINKMEKSRVQAYLQSACSVLGFSVGEIWCCRDNQGAFLESASLCLPLPCIFYPLISPYPYFSLPARAIVVETKATPCVRIMPLECH